ncbi:metallophosphatase family protein [Alicyclobacillus fastidiosus]|uniref:Metallophosphatase family protein n=1 Tax=Alicyclobacillus fastidiosus TaxID=392011 RepID=A0ABY6ZJV9_9BACL|nr:metallophosphoesterase family protein [Alicyclobacillus fastidiosus]WAH42456.1 metallophosphatase family protein [Alicyclobacillus fastidiosus]GMA64289.1 phosphodiesterase [Alicyclobacillus fastidiosus]
MSTKVAIITDVHGNTPALKAVLEDIDSQSNVEHIYCLGDMVAIGPDTDEVLAALFSREDVSMITGNHEDAVLAIFQGQEPASRGEESAHHEWIVQHTDKMFLHKLLDLPRSLKVKHEGKSLLLVHYHLDSTGNFLPIDRDPSSEKLDTIYNGNQAEMVCFGHHHPVHFFETADRTYLNPGSLGCCDRPVARYAVLDIDSTGITVEMKEIPYDNRQFLLSYEKLEVPARELILKVFHGNQHMSIMSDQES